MYYVLFYGGMVFAVAAFIYAVVYIIKNDIPGCIRDICKFLILAIILFATYQDITMNNRNIRHIPQNQVSFTGNESSVDGDVKRTDTTVSGDEKAEKPEDETPKEEISAEETPIVEEKDVPAIDISVEGLNEGWSSEDVELKVEITSENEIVAVSYWLDEKETVLEEYNEGGFIIDVTESATISDGVPVKITATDKEGNVGEYVGNVYIDKEDPIISDYSYIRQGDKIKIRHGSIFTDESISISVPLSDVGSGVDGETVSAFFLENGDENKKVELAVSIDDEGVCHAFVPLEDKGESCNGFVKVSVSDKAGNKAEKISEGIIYNCKKPLISWDFQSDYGKWSNEDRYINLKIDSGECGIKKVSVYVAGEKQIEEKPEEIKKKYECVLLLNRSAKKSSGYVVEIRVVDNCGNESRKKGRIFIDKELPEVQILGVEKDSYHLSDVRLFAEVKDVSYTETRVFYCVKRTFRDKVYADEVELKAPDDYKDNYNLSFNKEGEYEVYVKAIDGAGNEQVTDTAHFYIDKTAPEVAFYGVKEGAVTNKDVGLGMICEEDFYDSVNVDVTIKKSVSGRNYTNEPSVFKHDKRFEKRKVMLSEDGEYEVTMRAVDMAGNESATETIHFTIDKTAPDISMSGAGRYGQYAGAVSIKLKLEEEFYENSKVKLCAVKTDMDGNAGELELPQMIPDGKRSLLDLSFYEDGFYSLSVDAKDEAGNTNSKCYRFLIDSSAPEIYGIDNYDGRYYKALIPEDEVKINARDLTLKNYQLLLNGIEYDGVSQITAEGKYVLSAKATDELGHTTEKSAQFIIDSTAPEIVFYGVMDGETVEKEGIVKWELINSEDMINKITINGKECDANLRKLMYNSYGDYDIVIDSIDRAGNRGVSKMCFKYVKPTSVQKSKPLNGNKLRPAGKPVVTAVMTVIFGGILILIAVKYYKRYKKTTNN